MSIPLQILAGLGGNGSVRPTDPMFSNVTALMHFHGINNSTTIVDQKGNAITPNGTPTISTTRAKFGQSSLLLPGASHISIPTLGIGAQAATVEGWFYPTSLPANTNFFGMSNSGGSAPKWMLYMSTGGFYQLDCGNLGGGFTTSVAPALNTWTHIEIGRQANGLTTLYINGTSAGSGTTATLAAITAAFNIGHVGEAFGSKFIGNVDDFRVTIGAVRHTANFTPPTSQCPDI